MNNKTAARSGVPKGRMCFGVLVCGGMNWNATRNEVERSFQPLIFFDEVKKHRQREILIQKLT